MSRKKVKTKIMKKQILFMLPLMLAASLLSSCGGDNSNSNTKSASPKPEVRTQPKKTCKVCYKSYTGSGYQAFGEEFCSMKCYVDK